MRTVYFFKVYPQDEELSLQTTVYDTIPPKLKVDTDIFIMQVTIAICKVCVSPVM